MVPAKGSRTWADKGSKDVRILAADDKKCITIVVGSSLHGELLPLQVIFGGKTLRSTPIATPQGQAVVKEGWHLTVSENHWSVLETMISYCDKVLKPYVER